MQFSYSVESVSSVTVCNSDPLNKFSDVFIFIKVYDCRSSPDSNDNSIKDAYNNMNTWQKFLNFSSS